MSTMPLVMLGMLHAAVAAVAQEHTLLPEQTWSKCFLDGGQNILYSVQSSGRIYTGVALPDQAKKCHASKPSSCKMIFGSSCEAATNCQKLFPGELSGREKCLVVMNPLNDTQIVTVDVVLESPGNWGAIIFGIAAASCGLLGVMAAGCYADVSQMLAGHDKHCKQRSCRVSKAITVGGSAPPDPVLLGVQVPLMAQGVSVGQQTAITQNGLHRQ